MTDPDRPGVIFPPPLIYLAAILLGLGLHALYPLVLPVPVAVRWLGGVILVVGVAFGGFGRAEFYRAHTDANPYRPVTALVTSGVYRYSRNPMYVGMTSLLVGLALLTRVGWLLVLTPPVLAIMHWGVVRREERYMGRKFGPEYEAFRRRVRRYL